MDANWGRELKARAEIPDMKGGYVGTRQGGHVPDVTGMGLMDAIYALENSGFKCTYEGLGHVVRQEPKAGTKCSKGGNIYITLK